MTNYDTTVSIYPIKKDKTIANVLAKLYQRGVYCKLKNNKELQYLASANQISLKKHYS